MIPPPASSAHPTKTSSARSHFLVTNHNLSAPVGARHAVPVFPPRLLPRLLPPKLPRAGSQCRSTNLTRTLHPRFDSPAKKRVLSRERNKPPRDCVSKLNDRT